MAPAHPRPGNQEACGPAALPGIPMHPTVLGILGTVALDALRALFEEVKKD